MTIILNVWIHRNNNV